MERFAPCHNVLRRDGIGQHFGRHAERLGQPPCRRKVRNRRAVVRCPLHLPELEIASLQDAAEDEMQIPESARVEVEVLERGAQLEVRGLCSGTRPPPQVRE